MSEPGDEHWIRRAERALASADATDPDVTVLRGGRPPILDRFGASALLAPTLASFMWAAVVFRGMVEPSPIDPLVMLLRLLAVAFTVRTVLLYAELWRRARVALASDRYALVMTPEGLLFREPRTDVVIERHDVVAVVEHGDWRAKHAPGYRDVYVVLRPESGRTWVALPPVLDATPSALAERLSEWLGKVEGPEGYEPPAPSEAPMQLYDEVASGKRPPGVTVIRHGRAWMRRGPYATVLFGIAIVLGIVELPASSWALLGPIAIGALVVSVVIVPLAWLGITRREIAPRKGIAIVLTPAEALMREPRAIFRVRWAALVRATVEGRRAWSMLDGYHFARKLVLDRSDGPTIRYDEAFLGAPCEVVIALAQAYQRGVLGAPSA